MIKNWWKILAFFLVMYSVIAGFLFDVPRLAILNESIRNLYYHVPMWFAMVIMFGISVYHSIKHLATGHMMHDIKASQSVSVGIVLGILGLVTGAVWAQYTWGQAWSSDPKQNFAAIALLLYFAYSILRSSMDEEQKRGKISAIYNIFAFPMMVVLLFVLPRLQDSLHPGNGGNPGFNAYDLDSTMRTVFYPAVLGWILTGIWIFQLLTRLKIQENELNAVN